MAEGRGSNEGKDAIGEAKNVRGGGVEVVIGVVIIIVLIMILQRLF